MQQRNILLKQFAERGQVDHLQLAIYHEPMVALGEQIHQARITFLATFLPQFQMHYSALSDDREQVNINLESTFISGEFDPTLKAAESQDLAAQRSTIGIHRDEFDFEINGFPVKKFGSQGQQKVLWWR